MNDKEIMQMALDALESSRVFVTSREKIKHPEGTDWYDERIKVLRARLEQPEPEQYNKSELNAFVQDLYDKKLREGKHGLYETLFHVVHAAIKHVNAAPQREWQGLTDEEIKSVQRDAGVTYFVPADYDRHLFTHMTDAQLMKIARAIEAKLKEKNK